MPDFDRMRSFVERYVIARAEHFRVGFEREDAWASILDGKTVYERIGVMAQDPITEAQAGVSAGAATQAYGATGPLRPVNKPLPTSIGGECAKLYSAREGTEHPGLLARVMDVLAQKGQRS